jgi:hypothetical protein
MLCDLAVQVMEDGSHVLRISGRTAHGPSGTGGRDTKPYVKAEDVLNGLGSMGLEAEVITAAAQALSSREVRHRFIQFAEGVQIPFETLERAGIDLFD